MTAHVSRLVLLLLIPALVTAQIETIPPGGAAGGGGAVGGASNLTTVGAIPYVSASGVLNQDATKLFWDAANSRLGVGTAAPMTKLNVVETVTTSPRGILSSQYSTGTDGARVGFSKARGTEASPTTVITGDTLGRMMFRGYDGSNFLEVGSIEVVSTGTIAATRVPTYIAFSTATNATPSVLTEAIRITESQQLLVGLTTATGTKALTVNGGIQMYGSSATPRAFVGPPSWDTSYVAVQNATMTEAAANAALFQDTFGNTTLNASSAGYLIFKRANGEVARFAATTGNFLNGTGTDLGYGLHAANKATNGNLLVFDPTATTGTTKAVFVAGQGQSGNLTEWRAYNATPGSGTLLHAVAADGIPQWSSIAEPTCNSSNRGKITMVYGGAGVLDTLRVCRKDAADAYAWTALY